ncbi:quinone-dependent dihydroorotate dehydrogenase [Helicobacter apodemus]|uniref:Dihydroorotate dehydrogenase (quinone) n=1 Tax=Helicobacter apodemus TaxID=135569 RepID=A0A2U8FFJ3_9HELI|nr:quinone-dependent dihydroorotate dehydrogenase [Helicobacter apodemus]AWI34557.1 dihydroorotate dehydrogenase (quinone) [Helicobacter apodemus]
MFNYKTFRPLIFKSNPETAHSVLEFLCKIAPKIPYLLPFLAQKSCIEDTLLIQEIDGMRFYNPVGLAAGFDKNGTMIETLSALGFSFLEIGAVTPLPQQGNPKPRLWRHTFEESLQNAMGFNNDGTQSIASRIAEVYPFCIPLGINIGKNKVTPQEKAIEDYCALATNFQSISDYLSINISSPNTPNLRDLQNQDFLKALFLALREIYSKPIYLKISPDLGLDDILGLIEVSIKSGASGVIATNTTTDYSLVKNPQNLGGLSGKVLSSKSAEILKEIGKVYAKKTTIISVGGIFDAKEAYKRIALGANLVQVYTGLIFEGPLLAWRINQDLKELLNSEGLDNISQLVGVDL